MKIGEFDTAEKVFVIAEIGNNHEGSISAAEEMIGRAAEAGVDAVKFQSIDPKQLVSSCETQRLAQLARFQLSEDEYFGLADTAKREGVVFLSTPFYLKAVDFLNPLVPAFKIASGDNDFISLLRVVAGTQKPILLSTGMSDLVGIAKAIDTIESFWMEIGLAENPGIALLHCVSSYPTTASNANIGFLRELASLGHVVGYSDHTIGSEAVSLAIALGARVIEKHFTLDKNFSDFRDHQISCDPQEMKAYCETIRLSEVLLGSGKKRLLKCEEATHAAARRSLVAARDLPAGHVLQWSDFAWLRPGGSTAPGMEDNLLGKKLKNSLSAGCSIKLGLVE